MNKHCQLQQLKVLSSVMKFIFTWKMCNVVGEQQWGKKRKKKKCVNKLLPHLMFWYVNSLSMFYSQLYEYVLLFEHTYVPWRDNAIRIARCSMVIHKSRSLASERPHNWVIISLSSLVRFWYHSSFLHATILWGLSLAKQRTLCTTCCNMSIASPYYKVESISKVPYAISREKKMLATNIRLRNVVLKI